VVPVAAREPRAGFRWEEASTRAACGYGVMLEKK
jgi:hypothetical protein